MGLEIIIQEYNIRLTKLGSLSTFGNKMDAMNLMFVVDC